jgi:hypothetical protein
MLFKLNSERKKDHNHKGRSNPMSMSFPEDNVTIPEAERLTVSAAAQITVILQQLEAETGCQVHSVPVEHSTTGPVIARVKVQLS